MRPYTIASRRVHIRFPCYLPRILPPKNRKNLLRILPAQSLYLLPLKSQRPDIDMLSQKVHKIDLIVVKPLTVKDIFAAYALLEKKFKLSLIRLDGQFLRKLPYRCAYKALARIDMPGT